jgi:hypothetical protein
VAPAYVHHSPRPSRNPTWWWFLVPALSFGFGSFITVFLGGWKLKSRPHLYAAGAYLLTNVFYFCGAVVAAPADTTGPDAPLGVGFGIVMVVFLTVAWLGGTLHTVFLQLLVARFAAEPVTAPTMPHSPDPAIAAATWRAGRRAEARQLLRSNPGMAWELRIGRPDIEGRQYDDGGLVDVNHVPSGWLAYALQLPQALADEIATARLRHQGFSTPEELVIYCAGMTPAQLAMIRDFLVFRPR